MELKFYDTDLSVCKVESLDGANLSRELTFVGVTEDEVSLVCPSDAVPSCATHREDGWRAFRIEGPLDFSLVGILAEISSTLANANVGLFAVSTYDTDYILVKKDDLATARSVLLDSGHSLL